MAQTSTGPRCDFELVHGLTSAAKTVGAALLAALLVEKPPDSTRSRSNTLKLIICEEGVATECHPYSLCEVAFSGSITAGRYRRSRSFHRRDSASLASASTGVCR
jgi:hypothetical protein